MMNFEELLREEHNHLKNQITELKNAFDINRDILSILTKHNFKGDPQHTILLKIISKLTALNTQAMMSTCQLMQQKNALKAEIYRLNTELNRLEERLAQEINKNNQMITSPTEARLLLHDQFNRLNRQLLAFNEEKMDYEHEIAYWKQNCINNKQKQGRTHQVESIDSFSRKCKVKRKYTSIQNTKNDWLLSQQQLQIKRLNKNRTLLLIKAHHLQQESLKKKEPVIRYKEQWERQLEEIGLFKYALNVITVRKQDNDLFMNIKHRFRHYIDPAQKKKRNVHSWPKYKQFKYEISNGENGNKSLQKTWDTEDSK